MKTEEDEAFDELARRQGMWGGGFPAKRAMAADKLHWSDCAVHNGPAYPAGPCDWGPTQPWQEPHGYDWSMLEAAQESLREHMARIKELEAQLAQPAQEPVECLDCGSNNVGFPATYDSLVNSVKAQPAQEPVAWAVQGCSKMWREEFAEIDAKAEAKRIGGTCVAYALHAAPPQRPWVGLTPEDILVLFDEHNLYGSKLVEFTRAVETKIKEKNND